MARLKLLPRMLARLAFRAGRRMYRILVPRSLKVRLAEAVVLTIIVLAAGYDVCVAAPRSRADQLLRESVPDVQKLAKSLDQIQADAAKEGAFLDGRQGAITSDIVIKMQATGKDGRLATQDAIQASGQIQFIASSFGRSVQVGWFPILFGNQRVATAQTYLVSLFKDSANLDTALQTQALFFGHLEGMAPVIRDFVGYKPQDDLTATLALTDQTLIFLRVDRTLSDLDTSVTQGSQVSTPQELLDAQERWLKQFIIARALLTEIRQYVAANDRTGVNDRVLLYVTTIHDLQSDILDTLKTAWDQPLYADTFAQASAQLAKVTSSLR